MLLIIVRECTGSRTASKGSRMPNVSSCWRMAVPCTKCWIIMELLEHMKHCLLSLIIVMACEIMYQPLSAFLYSVSWAGSLGTRLGGKNKKKKYAKKKKTKKKTQSCVYVFVNHGHHQKWFNVIYIFINFSSSRRGTYASGSGSGLRPGARRGSSRLQSGTGTGGGHSGHSANSGDSLADDDDDI